ncbi:ATP synthase regulation protein NCA2-domain-containing protein [Phlyctochytrium arcticum]|nr:ATP synthase regulation protein NCA2-domain-containing protein [Phlyctochytrium arcticum]
MGFVSERLQVQLRAIDSLFRLDPDHFDVQHTYRRLFNNTLNEVTEDGSITSASDKVQADILALSDVLEDSAFKGQPLGRHSDSTLAEDALPSLEAAAEKLDKIKNVLYSSSSAASPGPSKSRYETAELAVAAKIAAVLHAHILHRLLMASTSLPPDISYWRDQECSTARSLYYVVQTLPKKLYRFLQSFIQAVRSHQPTHLRPQFRLFSQRFVNRVEDIRRRKNPVSTTFLGLGLSTLRPPPTIIELARHEIKIKRERLENAREVEASCLGLLTDHGIEIESRAIRRSLISKSPKGVRLSNSHVDDGTRDLHKTVSSVICLMNAILDKIAKVADDMTAEEELMWMDMTRLEEIAHSDKLIPVPELYSELHHAYTSFISLEWSFTRLRNKYGRPSRLTRYWFPLTVGALSAYTAKAALVVKKEDIIKYVLNAQDTLYSFFAEWIVKPLQEVYATVRHKEARLAITSAESLNSDLNALATMVVDYAKDQGVVDPAILNQVAEQANHGDLKFVLDRYTEEIKSPLKNALRGDLIRAVLIQVQKAKVDGEMTIAAMDKLLRSNELNFAFLAVVPSLMVTWLVTTKTRTLLRGSKDKNREKTYRMIRGSLRNIDRLLNQSNHLKSPIQVLPHKAHGLLLCEVYLLRKCVKSIPHRDNLRQSFVEDLRELEAGDGGVENDFQKHGTTMADGASEWTVAQRMETINRMWRTYPFLRGDIAK